MASELPGWIRIGSYDKEEYLKTKDVIDRNGLVTVCKEADCPNRYECFSRKTATFMILGEICTRNCRYCNIKSGKPKDVDKDEPERVADAVRKLGLKYAVITCVTRDDLEDGGAEHFVKTLDAIRKNVPDCKIELLISDLKGNWKALKRIVDSKPDVINHNIEVDKGLFPFMRPEGDYGISLELLRKVKEFDPSIFTKSGFMLGLGEKDVRKTLRDLKYAGCDIITVGQYLQPSRENTEVKKYYTPEEFREIKEKAEKMGFKKVVSGPLVRSSYKASECI
ncbi:MAG: lipoyl synthase [Nanobdellota archaeon]